MFSKLVSSLAISFAVTSATVLTRPQNTLHQRYSTDPAATVLLPFVTGSRAHLNFTNDPSIRYHFSWKGRQSSIQTVLVDTGSVGAVIGAHFFPNWTVYQHEIEQNPTGHILYTSSGKLLTGHFVDVDFEFDDGSLPLKAHAPILVVNQTVVCTNYTQLVDGHYCPKKYIKGADLCSGLSCENSYFGIGWSRGTNPASNNPLLNIVSVNNTPISGDYSFGYTITDEGLYVGLTEASTAGFTKVKLDKNSAAKFDWAQVQGCLEFTPTTAQATRGACVRARFLLDTGIDQGYATVTAENGVTGWRYYQDPDGTQQAHSQNFTKGWTVTSNFGADTNPNHEQYEFAFTLGKSPLAPPWLLTSLNTTTPASGSLNTGRHFFRVNDMLYDATNGLWGARLRYGTQITGTFIPKTTASSIALPPSDSLSSLAVPRTNSFDSQPTSAGAGQLGSASLVGSSITVTDRARETAQGHSGQTNTGLQSLGTEANQAGVTATAISHVGPVESQLGISHQSAVSGQGDSAQSGAGEAQSHENC